MSGKIFKIVDGDMSDGYHTFDELYEHRCLLFINLCLYRADEAYWRPHFENHNRKDNRIENLEVLSRKEHSKLHRKFDAHTFSRDNRGRFTCGSI